MAGSSRPTLEELLANVSQQYLNKPCTNEHLRDVAGCITKWPSLAPYLDLTDTDIEDVTSSGELKLQRTKLLVTWKQRFGRKATYLKLAKAFFAAGRADLVEKIKVECPHMEVGCKWTNELTDLQKHLNAEPRPGKEISGCEHVEVSCPHGCERKFQRHSLQQHMNECFLRPFSCEYCSNYSSTYEDVVHNHWEECPQYPLQCPNSCEDSPIERKNFEDHKTTCALRPFSCQYCSNYSSTHEDVVNNHWEECPQYPLPCPNNCEDSPIERKDFDNHKTTCPLRPFSCQYCSYSSTYQDVVNNHWVECPQYPLQCPNSCEDSPIERQHLEDHLNKDCPLEMVGCEFQFAGCTAQVQRRDLEAHMKDKLSQHITSTTNKLVTDMRNEINQTVGQQVTTLKDQMEQRQLQTGGVVKQEQAEVTTRQDSLERQLKQHEQTVKTASDNTQRQIQWGVATSKRYGMTVVAIIVAFVAILVAVIIIQHQQIQQLRQDHVEAIEKLSGDLQNLQYQLHHASLHVIPLCTAEGPGLYSPTVNRTTEITVSLVNFIGSEYTGKGVSVTAALESDEDGSITQANVSRVEASKYRVTYTPRVRGWSKLYVKVNNNDIKGSPFSLFVSPGHPEELRELDHPWGIAINSHGETYVTEWFEDKVTVFDTNRQKLPTFGSRGYEDGKFWYPTGIDIDIDDNVYVASEHKLQKFNRNGEHIKSVNSSRELRGVRVLNNKVFVCDRDNYHILVYDQELTFIRQFGTYGTGKGEFDRPYNIAFDAYGNAYVVESGNNRVQVLKEDGEFLRQFGRGELYHPRGIHINGDYVYVSDRNSVVVFRTSGEFVTTIGENLSEAHGITTDSNGRLYVCETLKGHCKVF